MLTFVFFSKICRVNIHSVINKICNSHILKFSRTIISYYQLTNWGEILKGGILSNISILISSRGFPNHLCNCNSYVKVDDKCAYGYEFITCCVVYKYNIETLWFNIWWKVILDGVWPKMSPTISFSGMY